MSRKFFYIRNDQGLCFFPTAAANTTTLFYPGTGYRSLERTQYQFLFATTNTGFHQVKSYPKPVKLLLQGSGDICQVSYQVGFSFQQSFNLWKQGLILISFIASDYL